ncbi:MAG TPA: lipase family protein [Woeseiaceae bacterium]
MIAEAVIFIPGIWLPAAEMTFLRRRLARKYALQGTCFGYRSVRDNLQDNTTRLAECIAATDAETVHLVGHSLGGVLALHTLANHEGLPVGRVVCLGSPLCGSRVALALTGRAWGRWILGNTLPSCVVERSARDWAATVTSAHEVGVIAGTSAYGIGRLIARFDDPGDGTVAVAETRLPGIKDHLLLPVTHTAMAISAAVAGQTAQFLQHGQFDHAPNH